MLRQKEFAHIQNTVFSLVDFSFPGQITLCEYDGVRVDFDGKNAVIGCKDKTTLARALFLLAMRSPKGAFYLEEKRSFDSFGVMFDLSRNRVLQVQTIQRYMDSLAALTEMPHCCFAKAIQLAGSYGNAMLSKNRHH